MLTCATFALFIRLGLFGCAHHLYLPTPEPRVCVAGPCLANRRYD